MNLWRRFIASQRGNMVVMFAAGFAVSAVVAAFAVDAGGLYYERRAVQNGVDLAALEAASSAATAQSTAHKSLQNAGLMTAASLAGLTVVTGRYDPNPAVAAANRFVANASPINAVQVSFSKPGTLYFANGWAEPPTISATAIATVTPQVAFSVGSRLAKVEGGAINGLLNGLLGTNISLTALDYNGLVGAQVDLFAFLDKLAIRLGVSVGTYNDLLAMRADHGQLAMALADLLTGTQRTAMLKLANAAGHNGTLPIGKLLQLGGLGDFDIGTGAANGLFTKISALDLLSASASLSDGKHQVNVGINLNVPGLLGLTTTVAVGEPPQGGSWYAIGPLQTVVRTAQVRARIVAKLKLDLLGLLPIVDVNLPLYLEAAHSEAIASAATCPTSASPHGSATILARPGALRLILGEVNENTFGAFNSVPNIGVATLIRLNIILANITVTAAARAEIAQGTPVALNFSSTDIAAGTIKSAKTSTIVSSLMGSLLGSLKLTVIGIGLDLITGLLSALLTPLGPVLDPVIAGLLNAVGVSIGEADVKVYGVRCTHPVLVG
ncbi:MAG TPA: TadG family pilus assembly protein [Devosia sp.]|nr:TadG family pilus assembly protein [Devosia sp.]